MKNKEKFYKNLKENILSKQIENKNNFFIFIFGFAFLISIIQNFEIGKIFILSFILSLAILSIFIIICFIIGKILKIKTYLSLFIITLFFISKYSFEYSNIYFSKNIWIFLFILSLFFIILINIFLKDEKNKKSEYNYDKNILKKYIIKDYIFIEIKNEIKEKGFFIYEVPRKNKILFLKELVNKIEEKIYILTFIFSSFFIFLIIFLFYIKEIPFEETLIFYIFIFPIFIFSYYLSKYFLIIINKNNFKNGIKSDFIIFNEKNIILEGNFIEFDYKNLEKDENIINIFKNKNFKNIKNIELGIIEEFILKIFKTKQEKNFSKLTNLFLNLQKNSDEIIILLKNLINIFENFENGKFENSKINSLFKNLEKNLQKIFIQKENILIFLEKNNLEEKINLEKYNLWLKNHIILPLILLKENLEKNLQKTEKEFENSKNSENPQIILANKRLEIKKNSLKNQILLIDEKIKKLEI